MWKNRFRGAAVLLGTFLLLCLVGASCETQPEEETDGDVDLLIVPVNQSSANADAVIGGAILLWGATIDARPTEELAVNQDRLVEFDFVSAGASQPGGLLLCVEPDDHANGSWIARAHVPDVQAALDTPVEIMHLCDVSNQRLDPVEFRVKLQRASS